MTMWHRFVTWLRSWFSPGEPAWKAYLLDDLPRQPRKHHVYLVVEDGHVWQVAMVCPCGCGDLIQLCVLPETSPSWAVTTHRDGTVTLSPSVWRTTGCRSHFFVRYGRIHWCRQSGLVL